MICCYCYENTATKVGHITRKSDGRVMIVRYVCPQCLNCFNRRARLKGIRPITDTDRIHAALKGL